MTSFGLSQELTGGQRLTGLAQPHFVRQQRALLESQVQQSLTLVRKQWKIQHFEGSLARLDLSKKGLSSSCRSLERELLVLPSFEQSGDAYMGRMFFGTSSQASERLVVMPSLKLLETGLHFAYGCPRGKSPSGSSTAGVVVAHGREMHLDAGRLAARGAPIAFAARTWQSG